MAQHYKLQFSHWEHVTPLPASPWPPGIPQRIHISCIASSDVLDSPVRTVPFWQALNPTFSVEVHNHTASRDFLAREYPQPVVERYDAIPQWAHRVRSDLWRVAYLLKYGGVYADSDIEPIVGVKQMVGPNDRFVTSARSVAANLNPHFIVARPGEPILERALHTILHNLRTARPDMPFDLKKYWSWTICTVLYNTLVRRWNGTMYPHGCGTQEHTRLESANTSLAARASLPCPEDGVRLLGEGSVYTLHEENNLRKIAMAPPDRVLMYTKYLTDADTSQWYASADGVHVRRIVCAGSCTPQGAGPKCGRQAWRQGTGAAGYTLRTCTDGNWSLPRCLMHSKRKDCLTH